MSSKSSHSGPALPFVGPVVARDGTEGETAIAALADGLGAARPCGSCHLVSGELRRGVCRRCRSLGATDPTAKPRCAICQISDARLLVRKVLPDGAAVLCGSHALLAERTGAALATLVAAVSPAGDRRKLDRRLDDRRAPRDRRSGGRNGWLFACSRTTGGRRAADAQPSKGNR